MNAKRLAVFRVGRSFGLRTMSDIWNRSWEFLLLFPRQIAGGPGPPENNLVRFGLPAILWETLLYIAWHHQRSSDLPLEKSVSVRIGVCPVERPPCVQSDY